MSSSPSRPTLIFAVGAWHEPACFDLVRERLEHAGYVCHAPAMPSIGDHSATKTTEDDVRVLRDVVRESLEKGDDVVVVAHSAGGFKICAALEGLVGRDAEEKEMKGRVLGIAMIAAFIPHAPGGGEAFKDVPSVRSGGFIFNKTDNTVLPDDPKTLFYNDLSEEDAEYWASRIRSTHVALPGSFQAYEAWRHVPVSYLFCDDDQIQIPARQEALIKAARAEGGVVHVTHVDAGHSPFLSMPEKVVEWIEKAIGVEFV